MFLRPGAIAISRIPVWAGIAATVLAALVGCAEPVAQDDVLDVAFQEQISNLDRTFTTKREYIILSQLIADRRFPVRRGSGHARL